MKYQHNDIHNISERNPLLDGEYVVYLPPKENGLSRRQRRFAVLAPHMKDSSRATSMSRVRRSDAYVSPLLKIVGVFVLMGSIVSGLTKTGETVSYFTDIESSLGNILIADPIAFKIERVSGVEGNQINMEMGTQTLSVVVVPALDSEPIQYSVKTHEVSGDTPLCDALNLRAEAPLSYDGALLGLHTGTTTTFEPWFLSFSLNDTTKVATGTSCFVDFVFEGRNADSPVGKGYTDTQHLSLQFYIPSGTSAVGTSTQETASSSAELLLIDTPDSGEPLQSTTTQSEATTSDTILPSMGNGGGSGGGGGNGSGSASIPTPSDDVSGTSSDSVDPTVATSSDETTIVTATTTETEGSNNVPDVAATTTPEVASESSVSTTTPTTVDIPSDASSTPSDTTITPPAVEPPVIDTPAPQADPTPSDFTPAEPIDTQIV